MSELTREDYLRARGWQNIWTHRDETDYDDLWQEPNGNIFTRTYNVKEAEKIQLDRDEEVLRYIVSRRAIGYDIEY